MTTSHGLLHRICTRASLPVVAGALACGGEGASGSDATSQAEAFGPSQATAVFELGEDTYTFERVTCDLNDSIDDDVLVRASGTAPDDRRMSLVVEQRIVGDLRHERVTLYFGSMMEGDHWNSYGTEQPSGNWVTENGGRPLDGPLLVKQGDELTAEGTFDHETRDASQAGALRVNCGG